MAVIKQRALDPGRLYGRLKRGYSAAGEVSDGHISIAPVLVSHFLEAGAESDVFRRECISLVKPPGLSKNVPYREKARPVECPRAEKAFPKRPFALFHLAA